MLSSATLRHELTIFKLMKSLSTRPTSAWFSPWLLQDAPQGLLWEVAYKARVLYACMQSEDGTGYPCKSSRAIPALFDGLDKTKTANYVTGLVMCLGKCFESDR